MTPAGQPLTTLAGRMHTLRFRSEAELSQSKNLPLVGPDEPLCYFWQRVFGVIIFRNDEASSNQTGCIRLYIVLQNNDAAAVSDENHLDADVDTRDRIKQEEGEKQTVTAAARKT